MSMRRKQIRSSHPHYCLLINRAAGNVKDEYIRSLTGLIREKEFYYTVVESDKAAELFDGGLRICSAKRSSRGAPAQVARRGNVTAVVAIGGDGTVSLGCQIARHCSLPLGIIPAGRSNTIARALLPSVEPDAAIKAVLNQKYISVDILRFGNTFVMGWFSLGYLVTLAEQLKSRTFPRFGLGWSRLAADCYRATEPMALTIKVDSFKFEVVTRMVHVAVLPRTFDLAVNPGAIVSDQKAEILFDVEAGVDRFTDFLRESHRDRWVADKAIRLFRGQRISIEPIKGAKINLDGDFASYPDQSLELVVADKQLRVFV